MRYSAGTSLADFERGVIEATDSFNDADVAFRSAEQARAEARVRLEKAQRAFDDAYAELKSRAPGGAWLDRRPALRGIGLSYHGTAGEEAVKAVARALAAE